MIRIALIVFTFAIACCLPNAAQAQGYQDLNASPPGYDGAPNLRGPMGGAPGTPVQYVNPQPIAAPQAETPMTPTRIQRKHEPSPVVEAVGMPGKAVKTAAGMTDRTARTGVGLTDRTAKTGVGLTSRTAKTGVGLTDRAAKTVVGAPLKAVKETFKMIF